MDGFETFPEQAEAKRLLRAALAEGPAHAYLLHGPPGVGKRRAATVFAGELLGDRERTARGTHPDFYLLAPLGDQIRIDDVRELRRDLHMRPFEASRRVYLVFAADTMNEDAADALHQAAKLGVGADQDVLAVVERFALHDDAACAPAGNRARLVHRDRHAPVREGHCAGHARVARADDRYAATHVFQASHSLRSGVSEVRRSSTRKPSRSISSSRAR